MICPLPGGCIAIRTAARERVEFALWDVQHGGQVDTPDGITTFLTDKQIITLDMIARGLTTADIQRELTVEASTVKNAVTGIGHALGVTGKVAIVQEARRRGWLGW